MEKCPNSGAVLHPLWVLTNNMRKAFTLVELLIIIAIIGILATIIITTVIEVRKNEGNCQEVREQCVSECFKQEEKCLIKN